SLDRACAFAARVAERNEALYARQAASGLYYTVAATVLAHEGMRLAAQGDARRLLLAALVDVHRLRAWDPFAPGDASRETGFADLLLPETPVALEAAQALLGSGAH
ncbi:MAG: DNA alkylation response protein, partial [Burkholderiales bacterium]